MFRNHAVSMAAPRRHIALSFDLFILSRSYVQDRSDNESVARITLYECNVPIGVS